jgi:large-conductance mechanosensitive channel
MTDENMNIAVEKQADANIVAKEKKADKNIKKKVVKEIQKDTRQTSEYDKLINLLNSTNVISLAFATTLGYGLNGYLTKFASEIVIPLLDVNQINFDRFDASNIKWGSFLEHTISFIIIVAVTITTLRFMVGWIISKGEIKEKEAELTREKQSTTMIALLQSISDSLVKLSSNVSMPNPLLNKV